MIKLAIFFLIVGLSGCMPRTVITPKQDGYSTRITAYSVDDATRATNNDAKDLCGDKTPIFIEEFNIEETRLGFWTRLDTGHGYSYTVTSKFICE